MTRPGREPPAEPVTRRQFVSRGVALGGAAAAAGLTPLPAAEQPGGEKPTAPSPGADGAGPAPAADPGPPFVTSGVVPRLGVSASLKGPRSECGIGALMPWGGRLWFVTYVAHGAGTGSGTGLYWVDGTLTVHKHPASVVGTYANRLVHRPTGQMILGPHLIDADNTVRTFDELAGHRLTATLTHLHEPKDKVYFLSMESEFWEADLRTLKATRLFTLNDDLKLPKGSRPHYKGGFTAADRVVVANNTYGEADETEGVSTGGRLAEWDGRGGWRVVEATAFCDVTGRQAPGHAAALASGWDRASALLLVLAGGKWTRYRLPKASHAHDHAWYTEWPRIREVETERFLMDLHGMFYELTPLAYGGRVWGVKPVCQHLRMVPDFCSWRGLLVLAGDQATAVSGNDLVGEPQSNLWLGKTDDLWSLGRPQGWGGPWYDTKVEAGWPSDPYLLTGFVHKGLHLALDAGEEARFTVEVDFLGTGRWQTYAQLAVPARGYAHHEFPDGFGAHWVRVTGDRPCTATAWFTYT